MGAIIEELDLILDSGKDSALAMQEQPQPEIPATTTTLGATYFKDEIIKALEGGASDTDEKQEIIKAME